MKQQLAELERIHFLRAFPWMHLFRAFRIALDIRKMLLGAAALLVLFGGFYGVSYFPLDLSESEIAELRKPPWELETLSTPRPDSLGDFDWGRMGRMLSKPVMAIVDPVVELFQRKQTWSGAAIRWTRILWLLGVWSFFGTAISRMSAVQFALDERVSLKQAGAFAGSKWLWVFSAPLMPMAGVLLLWFLCVVGGWIGRIPGAGPVIVGVLWIVPLLLALAMVLLLIGLVFGWPLMIGTISAQGSDAFDGFSRSFDYVYSRFWHLVWFVIVAAAYGMATLLIVWGVAMWLADLAAASVWAGMGAGFQNLSGEVPNLFGPLGQMEKTPSHLAGRCVSAWLSALALLVAGYGVSYFWSASTIIYFLLRQSEDANHLSEVYLPNREQSDDLVQLAGVAASDQPIVERPAKHESKSSEPSPDQTGEKPRNDQT